MAFAKHFPATIWLWRRLTSRVARRVALYFVLALVIVALILRIYTAVFVYRVHAILAGMEQLKSEQTAKADMLKVQTM